MRTKHKLFLFGAVVMTIVFSGCNWFRKSSGRETIFDKVVSIPKELILDIPYLPPLCDEIPGLKKGFVDVPGGKLYYEEEGQGIPLLLINGGPGGTHHAFHPYFSQIKDFAHVIYYDQRGTGKSSKDDTGKTYSIKQAVEDIESLRKALKIDKWAVLGWSYGGFLAQCYALTYPEHITGLVLIDSSYGLTKVKMKSSRQGMFLSKTEKDSIGKIWAAKHEGKLTLAQSLYNAHLAGDWKRQDYYKPTPEEFIRGALYEWSPAPGFRPLICAEESKISLDGKFYDFEIPTLIMEAKWDLTWDTDKAEFMRKNHPGAQFEYFEKSGHNIFADEPEKFFTALKSFLEKFNNAQIVYKPGNRLTWPKPISDLICKIAVAGDLPDALEREKRILEFYDQAVRKSSMDDGLWERLFDYFLNAKKHYDKCLYALNQYEITAKKSNPEQLQKYGHCINVWRGMVLDLLGRREEAIKCYQEVLQNFKEKNNHCSQVDRKWLKERLKTPFKWE